MKKPVSATEPLATRENPFAGLRGGLAGAFCGELNPNVISRGKRTRTGKVARIPFKVRRELCERLKKGESRAALVAWLNSLPEVQAILPHLFRGKPISLANLGNWIVNLSPKTGKRAVSPKRRKILARIGFVADVRSTMAGTTAGAVFSTIERSYGYRVEGSWQRGRCAMFAAVCSEFLCHRETFPIGICGR